VLNMVKDEIAYDSARTRSFIKVGLGIEPMPAPKEHGKHDCPPGELLTAPIRVGPLAATMAL
jgi:hypothetical protein